MRLWRCTKGLLIEYGPGAAVVNSLLATSRRRWRDPPRDYWLVDAGGGIVERFSVTVGSVDDELGATLFVVEGQALVKLVVREVYGRDATLRETVVLADLDEVPDDDAISLGQARGALARADTRRAEAIRQGEARVAAIPGADDVYDAGEGLRAAQRALRARVAAYGEPLSAALLGALARFGDLYESAPSVEPALDTFVDACRRAARAHGRMRHSGASRRDEQCRDFRRHRARRGARLRAARGAAQGLRSQISPGDSRSARV
jgi:hypothetical protein